MFCSALKFPSLLHQSHPLEFDHLKVDGVDMDRNATIRNQIKTGQPV